MLNFDILNMSLIPSGDEKYLGTFFSPIRTGLEIVSIFQIFLKLTPMRPRDLPYNSYE